MSISDTIRERQINKPQVLTKSIAQNALHNSQDLLKSLGLTPTGDLLDNKDPQKNFRIIKQMNEVVK